MVRVWYKYGKGMVTALNTAKVQYDMDMCLGMVWICVWVWYGIGKVRIR